MSFWIAMLFLASTGPSSPVDSTAQPWFAFSYNDGWGTQIDTYQGTLTKDSAVKTIPFALSAADMDSIRQKAIAVRVLEIPEPHPDVGTCRGTMYPNTTVHLRVSLGAKTKDFSWSTKPTACVSRTDDWQRLGELQRLIRRVIERQRAYQMLPAGRGGYM